MMEQKANISFNPGIYVHIPFCERKCGYCDFYSVTSLRQKRPFLRALLQEITLVANKLRPGAVFDSLYFGGGTPSLLNPEELHEIIESFRSHFTLSDTCEITLEANPGTVVERYLRHYRQAGINRLSIGIQSFDEKELELLERIHSVRDALQTITAARQAGFTNISIDLIYALPGQTMRQWRHSLQKAVELKPEHISAYNLIFEERTPFYKRKLRGELQPKSADEEYAFFLFTNHFLEEHGYRAYEVSNYARGPQFYSRHNYKYWLHVPYLGFGPSAHSFWAKQRWGNVRSLSRYLRTLNEKRLPEEFRETITSETEEFEHIFLRLRTYEGVNIEYFEKHFGRSFFDAYRKTINALLEKQYARFEAPFFRLTKQGMAICDEILAQFA